MLEGKERIVIVGSGGAGKSTLAGRLGPALGLPVIHLDNHFWRPGWQQAAKDEWNDVVDTLLAEPRWIMDGNYSGTFGKRFAASDAVVFLDLSRLTCLLGVLRRWYRHRGRDRSDLATGCPERMTLGFLSWVWNFERRTKPRLVQALAEHAQDKEVHILRSRADVTRLLEGVVAARG